MDGVLVDNLDVHKRAFRLFFSRYGVDKSIEELSRMFGKGNDDIMRELMPAEVVERVGLRELGYEKEAIYREIYAPTIAPTRGLTEFLSECRRRGLKCAVGSSGCMANVDFVLDGCGIRDSFEAVVAGDRVRRCKPDPEIYLTAAAALGLACRVYRLRGCRGGHRGRQARRHEGRGAEHDIFGRLPQRYGCRSYRGRFHSGGYRYAGRSCRVEP